MDEVLQNPGVSAGSSQEQAAIDRPTILVVDDTPTSLEVVEHSGAEGFQTLAAEMALRPAN